MEVTRLKAVLEKFSYLLENIDRDEFLSLLVQEKKITEEQKDSILKKEDDSPLASLLLSRLMKFTSFEQFVKFLKKIKMKRNVIQDLKDSVEAEAESSKAKDTKEGGSTKWSETGASAKSPMAAAPPRLQDPDSILSKEKAQEIFEVMHNTMLHDPDSNQKIKGTIKTPPSATYGLFTVNKDKWSTLMKNVDRKMHMEVKVMVELMKRILSDHFQGPELKIVLHTNWSPCPFCVYCIVDFLQWSKDRDLPIRLTIKVAALYRITWPECEAWGCEHLSFSRKYHQVDHQEAIKKLFQHSVFVEAFTEKDWNCIKRALGLPSAGYPHSLSRQRTDCMVQLSLRVIKESLEVDDMTAMIAAANVS